MRHTDVLLKNFQETRRPEDVARREALDDIQTEARHIQELLNSPGWAHFINRLHVDERALLRGLEQTQDPTSLARLAGCLLVTKSYQSWAEDRLKDLETVLVEAQDQ